MEATGFHQRNEVRSDAPRANLLFLVPPGFEPESASEIHSVLSLFLACPSDPSSLRLYPPHGIVVTTQSAELSQGTLEALAHLKTVEAIYVDFSGGWSGSVSTSAMVDETTTLASKQDLFSKLVSPSHLPNHLFQHSLDIFSHVWRWTHSNLNSKYPLLQPTHSGIPPPSPLPYRATVLKRCFEDPTFKTEHAAGGLGEGITCRIADGEFLVDGQRLSLTTALRDWDLEVLCVLIPSEDAAAGGVPFQKHLLETWFVSSTEQAVDTACASSKSPYHPLAHHIPSPPPLSLSSRLCLTLPIFPFWSPSYFSIPSSIPTTLLAHRGGTTVHPETPYLRFRQAAVGTTLRPTIAQCLARMANVEEGMVMVDTCGGTASIPIELGLPPSPTSTLIVSGDASASATRTAVSNIAAANSQSKSSVPPQSPGVLKSSSASVAPEQEELHQAASKVKVRVAELPIDLLLWDGRGIPLRDGAVDRIITDLPWGTRSSTHASNYLLYPRLFAHVKRLLVRPGVSSPAGGRGVFVTGEMELMASVARYWDQLPYLPAPAGLKKLRRFLEDDGGGTLPQVPVPPVVPPRSDDGRESTWTLKRRRVVIGSGWTSKGRGKRSNGTVVEVWVVERGLSSRRTWVGSMLDGTVNRISVA
ncbi:hypothetical protein M427DRAFT_399292 [Gonapodya prolifera JEL478]|uniref:Ribosomal RNA large subunit methyltransferase K/L-like methyltransferase domain-containing protein n=1 Tax=Gonapodya prolifera (strain JEL478) TaxID=1344416 RepID=A0A139A6N0_GONPJ|nr:hypothetical protein M427DRAFT_399292 [Gonapodya prolifera JEL478]|eukprot:KXS12354.1 hypothetical protein M427DRAFT_399292 [Gonapodya prolifera JEL478]